MRRISFDASLQHRDHFVREFVKGAIAVRYGGGLETIELVEFIVDGGVRNKVVDIIFFCSQALRVVDERRGAGEGIVHISDQFRVGEGLPSEL